MATNMRKPGTLRPSQKSVSANDPQVKSLKADGDERQRCDLYTSIVPRIHLQCLIVDGLRDDMTAAMKATFTKPEPDPQTRFHEQLRKEADKYDRGFGKKYRGDLNTILIFMRCSH